MATASQKIELDYFEATATLDHHIFRLGYNTWKYGKRGPSFEFMIDLAMARVEKWSKIVKKLKAKNEKLNDIKDPRFVEPADPTRWIGAPS